MRRIAGLKALLTIPAVALVAVALVALPAFGQTTTAQIRGTVSDTQGPIPGVTLTAVNTANGAKASSATAVNGTYVLVLAAGTYEISVATGAHEPWKKAIRAGVGQSLTLDVALKPGKLSAEVAVVATAEAQVDRVTSEMGTNISETQLQMLPQSSRNFLNAAVLAPGVRISRDEERQEYSYGAQRSMNTNVFIDGTSYKNDILQGGSVGQDSSKGNPFPQNAVQEFRVITQNFKAEYQKASSAIITAVTKSGSNELHGEVFAYYQDKELVATDGVQQRRADQGGYEVVKPEYSRWQPGVSLGGPIVKDTLHFFAAYEGNSQDREYEVRPDTWGAWSPAFRQGFTQYEGLFDSEFRSTLFFGKVTGTLTDSSSFDVSGDYRHETDIRGFGNGPTSYQAAENVKNDVYTVRGKHTMILGNVLNEAGISFQRYKWNPVPQDTSTYGQNYQGLMRIGSKDSQQRFEQERFAFRDDVTLLSLSWVGEHVVKGGLSVDFLDYTTIKEINVNPLYQYRADLFVSTPGDMPFQAQVGFGNPDMSASNTQVGLYLQDDWRFSSRVTANIGVRWDYESDMLNNDYVTPPDVVAGFGPLYPSKYFTDGTKRDGYDGMIQPRLGLSWDITGDGKTVVHGGWGIYADRTLFNDMLDEKYRTQWNVSTIYFSEDGSPVDNNPALVWNPAYYDPAVLRQLVDQGIAGQPEVYLFDNDNLDPPSSNQWSLGVRHNFGAFNASVAYTNVHGKDQLTWTCAAKRVDNPLECDWGIREVPGFTRAILSRTKESWFESIQVVLEKPYSRGWGGSLSYVYGDAEQTGNDFFSANALDPLYGRRQRSNLAQEHQFTLSGMVDLPWSFRLSTLVTTGSGYPYGVNDCSAGWTTCTEYVGEGDPPKWTQSIDFRLEKRFTFGGPFGLNVFAEVLNISNYTNEKDYEGFKPALPDVNANFGKANNGYNPRRLQFGASLSF